jgi:ribosome-associated protein
MKHRPVPEYIVAAVEAAEEKQAVDLVVLDLGEQSSFADYFLISSGRNPRQSQAICDEIEDQLKRAGCKTKHLEGYHQGEWILMDYGFLVVHIFSEKARGFYDLERLWRTARKVPPEETR